MCIRLYSVHGLGSFAVVKVVAVVEFSSLASQFIQLTYFFISLLIIKSAPKRRQCTEYFYHLNSLYVHYNRKIEEKSYTFIPQKIFVSEIFINVVTLICS